MNQKSTNVCAIISMAVGIIALLLSCCYGGFLGIAGLVLGIIGIVKYDGYKAMSIVGIITSSIALFTTLMTLVLGVSLLTDNSSDSTTESTTEMTTEATTTEEQTTESTTTEATTEASTEGSTTESSIVNPADVEYEFELEISYGEDNEYAEYDVTMAKEIYQNEAGYPITPYIYHLPAGTYVVEYPHDNAGTFAIESNTMAYEYNVPYYEDYEPIHVMPDGSSTTIITLTDNQHVTLYHLYDYFVFKKVKE